MFDPALRAAVGAAVEEASSRNSRRLAVVRMAATASFLALFVALGHGWGRTGWRAGTPAMAIYAALAAAIWLHGRHRARVWGAAGVALFALDLPAIMALELLMIEHSARPPSTVTFFLAIVVVIVMGASVFLRPVTIVATMVLAAAWQAAMFHWFGEGGPSVILAVGMIALAGALSAHTARRVRQLVRTTAVHVARVQAAEQALAEAEEAHGRMLGRVLEQLPDAAMLTRDGAVIYANAGLGRLVGAKRAEELVGGSAGALAAPRDETRLLEHLYAAAAGGVGPIELAVRGVDGGDLMVEVLSAAVEADGARAVVSVLRDTTERRAVQESVLLADRLAATGTMAAGMAHEINNPMTAVIANLDYVIEESTEGRAAISGDLREALRDARDAAGRVRDLVRDLKLFARGQEEASVAVELAPVVESTLRLARPSMAARARVVVDLAPVPPVVGTASRVGQVLLNLLVNAAQAIPDGEAERHTVRVVTRVADDGRVMLEVEDDGVGMSPEVQRRMFEPFFTTKPVGVGTGLGLPVVRRLVQDMGGAIECQSAAGRGTHFRVLLPAARRAAPAPGVAPEPGSAPAARVLVVDDDDAVGRAAERILGREHDVIYASSGHDALSRLIGGERYQLILCDLMMPGMTGATFFEHLRRVLPEQARAVRFMTGGALTSELRDFAAGAARPVIEKPFDAGGLLAAVRSAIGGRS
jgi:PAS domain S-box-containing protein